MFHSCQRSFWGATIGLCLTTLLSPNANAQVSIEYFTTLRPNFRTSPNRFLWVERMWNAFDNNNHFAPIGDPNTDPGAFLGASDQFTPHDIVLTYDPPTAGTANFHSWRGQADPTGPFAGEYGNGSSMPFRVLGKGTKIRRRNLFFDIKASNGTQFHLFTAGAYGGAARGIDYGPDGIKGTGDDKVYMNGVGTDSDLVDEYISAFNFNFPALDNPNLTHQEMIEASLATFYDPFQPFEIVGYFTMYADDQTTVLARTETWRIRISDVPEPGTVSLLCGAGVCGAGLFLRRRRVRR